LRGSLRLQQLSGWWRFAPPAFFCSSLLNKDDCMFHRYKGHRSWGAPPPEGVVTTCGLVSGEQAGEN